MLCENFTLEQTLYIALSPLFYLNNRGAIIKAGYLLRRYPKIVESGTLYPILPEQHKATHFCQFYMKFARDMILCKFAITAAHTIFRVGS